MAIPEEFLDRLRAHVRISEVAERYCGMRFRREGRDQVCVDNHSLKINDKEGIWKDFGNGEKGGDVFAFLQAFGRRTFPEAVDEVAKIAGLDVPRSGNGGYHPSGATARQPTCHGEPVQPDFREGHRIGVPVATWSYTDASGREMYQTVRLQWRNGEGWETDPKTGKPKKTFYQRRRTPDVDGCWINALAVIDEHGDPIRFMRKGPGKDWRRWNEKNYRDWKYTEVRTFEAIGNVPHSLLYLPEIEAEMAEERHEQRTVFLPEGEKKVDLLRSWGLLATCNSGGAQNWHDGMAKLLADAADIVILEDNDDAGRQRTDTIAPSLLEHGARVRRLALPAVWSGCPPKGDIVDWADAGGDRDALFRATRSLADWTPPPYSSKFGAHAWGSHNDLCGIHYEWTIKGLIPKGQNVLIMGPSGSGKSFETTGLALAVARGVDNYRGRKVKKCGVVYVNYEAGGGMPNRLKAYQEHYKVNPKEFIPFTWVTKPPGLYVSADKAVELAAEIKELTRDWTGPNKLGVIVIDTHNAATRGSSEIKTEDVTRVMDRYDRLAAETGAAIWIVSHTNQSGNHRGNEVLYNSIDTCIMVEKIQESRDNFVKDANGNVLRRLKVRKQREGVDGEHWDFVLQQVKVGTDEDGEPITSMVSANPSGDTTEQKTQKAFTKLTTNERLVLQAITTTYEKYTVAPPTALGLPRSITGVIRTEDFLRICAASAELDDDERRKACNSLQAGLWISQRVVDGVRYMWRIRGDRAKPIVVTLPTSLEEEIVNGDD